MLELGDGYRLSVESLPGVGIAGQEVMHDLDRNHAFQLRVSCPVHDAHAPLTELGLDCVAPKLAAYRDSGHRLTFSLAV